MSAVQAHDPGPQVAQPNGIPTFGGVRALQLRADGRTLLSGGADGAVRVWDVADGAFRAEKLLKAFSIGTTFQKETAPVRDIHIHIHMHA